MTTSTMRRLILTVASTLVACGDDAMTASDGSIDDGAPADTERATLLSQTGLYVAGTHDIAPSNELFAPTHVLWSDGAIKRRWIALPAGAQIDTSDIDHWRFPVGTKLWKEFASPTGTLLETRLIERIAATGNRETDFWMGAFVWRSDGSDAEFAVDGATNINGTEHDAPAQNRCPTCHLGEPGNVLGFSTLQLSGAGTGIRLADLGERLSTTIPQTLAPGDATVAAGLGYLHANCGHCHNPSGSAWPDVDMDLRLYASATTPAETTAYRTAVNVTLTRFQHAGITLRIDPGSADKSAVVYRMSTRGSPDQMPPIATERVDPDTRVRTWIDGM